MVEQDRWNRARIVALAQPAAMATAISRGRLKSLSLQIFQVVRHPVFVNASNSRSIDFPRGDARYWLTQTSISILLRSGHGSFPMSSPARADFSWKGSHEAWSMLPVQRRPSRLHYQPLWTVQTSNLRKSLATAFRIPKRSVYGSGSLAASWTTFDWPSLSNSLKRPVAWQKEDRWRAPKTWWTQRKFRLRRENAH